MRTFVMLFLSSAAFGVAISVVYWIVAHEPVGMVLLGIMTAALIFAAGYAILAERDADLAGDREKRLPESTGEDLGIFTTESAWPILTACCVLATLLGILWSPLVAVAGIACLILTLWRMGAESARI